MNRREPSSPPAIPGFTYVQLLGMGGFADVFLYIEDRLGRQDAVKVLLPNQPGVSQPSFPEASLMARLSNHPSIVSVYRDGVTDDGRPYLVMEYCPPPSLSARLRVRPLSVVQALAYGVQIAGAVHTAHVKIGILHRDIKPANILFTEYGRPALTDFGISVPTGVDGTGIGVGMSVAWAPPEQQIRGGKMGRPGDVYALGATIYHMLAGHSPYHAPTGANDNYELSNRVRNAQLPRLDRLDVPESLQRVLATAMAKKPVDRYQTALEIARALNAVQLELHHPATVIDVLDDNDLASLEEDEDSGGTKVDNFVLIDPDGPSGPYSDPHPSFNTPTPRRDGGRRPAVIQHGRGVAEAASPIEWTGFTEGDKSDEAAMTPEFASGAGPSSLEHSTEEQPVPVPPRNGLRWRLVAAAIVAAAAVGGFIVYEHSGGPATKSPTAGSAGASKSPPADPIGAIVPTPTSGAATARGREVTFSWKNPAPQPGDGFLYRVDNPGSPGALQDAHGLTATVATQPGRTCIDVTLRRSSGHPSDPLTICYPKTAGSTGGPP